MNPIVLKSKNASEEDLEATFLPDKGMNMISYKKGRIEVIDQSTRDLFEERYAGLGALIGPHFHHKRTESIPSVKDEAAFPHIAKVKAKGVHDPFSHGIGRYAPWKTEATATKFSAVLTGKDVWNNTPLSVLEGQNFKMTFGGEMTASGLQLELSVVSDTDSLVGIHYYYHLPKGKGCIKSQVQKVFIDNNERKPFPQDWKIDDQNLLTFELGKSADYTFYPYPDPKAGVIILETDEYKLATRYRCDSQENSWQLYHPEGASFVCIEPLSSQDPRHPNLTVSSIRIQLEIL